MRRGIVGCFFTNSMLKVNSNPSFSVELEGSFNHMTAAVEASLIERSSVVEAKERSYCRLQGCQGLVILFKTTGDKNHLDRYWDRAVAGFDHLYFFELKNAAI